MGLAPGVTSKHAFLSTRSQRCPPVSLLKGFMVLHFTFKSMIHFESVSAEDVKSGEEFCLFGEGGLPIDV